MTAHSDRKPVTALVLAGSRGKNDPVAEAAHVAHKALAPVGGVPMLIRVMRALLAARDQGAIGTIWVAADHADIESLLMAQGFLARDVRIIGTGSGPSESVARAFAETGAPLFVTTADHALLKPEWITWFLDHAPRDADLVAALARADLVTAAAPDTRRTFLSFRDGKFSGCNLFYLASPRAANILSIWREAEALRKNPLRLARFLGLHIALGYGLGLLQRRHVLSRIEKLSGARPAFLDMPFGESAIDVDKPSDLALVERLAAREG